MISYAFLRLQEQREGGEEGKKPKVTAIMAEDQTQRSALTDEWQRADWYGEPRLHRITMLP